MSALRTQLEDAQVRLKQLDAELRAWPEKSPEREALDEQRAANREHESALERELAHLELELEALRVRVSEKPWWRSPLAIPFAIAGLLGAMYGAVWAVNHVNWAGLAWKYGWHFALAPLVVNGARYARGRYTLARRRQLGGGMKTE